jgi:hypothetical protein
MHTQKYKEDQQKQLPNNGKKGLVASKRKKKLPEMQKK